MSITGATVNLMFSIPNLFPTPQQIQGFAADNVFNTEPIESGEFLMGVDGVLSGGFVYVPVMQNYELQADSPSISFFDTWWATMQQVQDLFFASGTAKMPAIGKKWTMTKGGLSLYSPTPEAKKLLQPQRFRITWQSVIPAAFT